MFFLVSSVVLPVQSSHVSKAREPLPLYQVIFELGKPPLGSVGNTTVFFPTAMLSQARFSARAAHASARHSHEQTYRKIVTGNSFLFCLRVAGHFKSRTGLSSG